MDGQTVGDLVDALWQGRLIDLGLLEELIRGSAGPIDGPASLVAALVERGALTPFQAQECLAGNARSLSLGTYRFLDLLGEGAVGRVYLARHDASETAVAVKVVHPGLLDDSLRAHRFHREAEAATRLHHSNLVRIENDGVREGTHYLVMEHVEGIDLARFLEQSGPLETARACRFARDLALALQQAYDRRLMPSRVTARHVIVTDNGTGVKLLLAGQESLGRSATGLGEFEFGALLEPGPASWDELALASDIGALRTDAQAALAGLGQALMAMLSAAEPGRSAAADDLSVPAGLKQIIQKMLGETPRSRYEKPADCASALALYCEPAPVADAERVVSTIGNPEAVLPALHDVEDVPVGKVVPPRRSKRRALAASILFLIGMLAGGGATWLWVTSANSPPRPAVELASAATPTPPPSPSPAPAETPEPALAQAEPVASPDPAADPAVIPTVLAVATPAVAPSSSAVVEPNDPEPAAEAPANPESSPATAQRSAKSPFLVPLPEPLPAKEKEAEPRRPDAVGDAEYQRLVERGVDNLRRNRIESAIGELTRAINRKPDLADAYLRRAEAYAAKNSNVEVVADCDKALAIRPELDVVYRVRAAALAKLGVHGGAIDDATKLIEKNPNDVLAYNVRGLAHFHREEYREAIDDLTRALRLDDTLVAPLRNLSRVLSTARDASVRDGSMAVVLATRACTLTGWRDPGALRDLAAAYAACHQYERAVEFQTRALANSSPLPDTLVKQYRKALKAYQVELAQKAKEPARGLWGGAVPGGPNAARRPAPWNDPMQQTPAPPSPARAVSARSGLVPPPPRPRPSAAGAEPMGSPAPPPPAPGLRGTLRQG